jgi:hypothetical protein
MMSKVSGCTGERCGQRVGASIGVWAQAGSEEGNFKTGARTIPELGSGKRLEGGLANARI